MEDILDIFDEIASFEENWNGYGAQPIDPELISGCKSIYDKLNTKPDVFPTARNSIQFEYNIDEIHYELEIFRHKLLELVECHAGIREENIDIIAEWGTYVTALNRIKLVLSVIDFCRLYPGEEWF